jgi:hypothetical protein
MRDMKRTLALAAGLVAVGACASGGTPPNFNNDGDGPPQQADAAPKDAPIDEFADAPQQHDAPTPPPPDAAVSPPDMPPDACVPVATQRLVNPFLDLAPDGVGWMQVPLPNLPGGPYPLITADGLAAQTAPNKAWFGGAAGLDASPAANTLTDQMFQDIAIPANTMSITLKGVFATGTTETDPSVFDTFTLDILKTDGTLIENAMTLNNTIVQNTFAAFEKQFVNVAQMAGTTIRLRGTSTNDIINHTNFFLDNLELITVGCP